MFDQLGAVLARVTAKRARTPVHRHSREAGKCEVGIWKRTCRQDVRQIVLAAKRYEIAMKQRGARNGPLGAVALEILELLANLVDYRTGRLEPSLDTMMKKLRRSRDAIVRGLKALRIHGFVDWLRRYTEADNAGGKGPQVRQVSNAYRLVMPERARACLAQYGKPAPLPEDREHADAERTAALDAYRATLPLDQLALFEVGDNPVGNALKRLGERMMQRESAKQTESRSGFFNTRRE